MSESRLQRTRATLPEGYQFGDASAVDHHWKAVDESARSNTSMSVLLKRPILRYDDDGQ